MVLPMVPWRRNPGAFTTLKPGKLFLHVANAPVNKQLVVPGINAAVSNVYFLSGKKKLVFTQRQNQLTITLPSAVLPDDYNTVIVVEYTGSLQDSYTLPAQISAQYESFSAGCDQ